MGKGGVQQERMDSRGPLGSPLVPIAVDASKGEQSQKWEFQLTKGQRNPLEQSLSQMCAFWYKVHLFQSGHQQSLQRSVHPPKQGLSSTLVREGALSPKFAQKTGLPFLPLKLLKTAWFRKNHGGNRRSASAKHTVLCTVYFGPEPEKRTNSQRSFSGGEWRSCYG